MGMLQKAGWAALGGLGAYVCWRELDKQADVQRYRGVARGRTIAILGAGFGGAAVAAELTRLLPEAGNGEITVIDDDNFLLFTPMLTEAAGGELDPRHIAVPLRRFSRRVRFVQGVVTSVDLASKKIRVDTGGIDMGRHEVEITADHIVMALGSVTNFHHVPGVADHALCVKRLEDAARVCERALRCLERASVEDNDERRKALLTFIVAGGGYTGVETMAALNDLVRDQAPNYTRLESDEIRMILVNPGEQILHETSPELAAYAAQKLSERGVEIRSKTSITGASADAVELSSGERIGCRMLVWAAGVKPNPVISNLDVPKGKHGGLKVERTCEAVDHPGLWALGDCAEIPNPEGGTYAPTAQNATREGALVARNIVRSLAGAPLDTFRYKPIGQLALVGKHSGVARIWGLNFSGLTAWAMWRAVYLAKMPGTAQKVRVATDWLLDLMFGRDPIPSNAQPVKESVPAEAGQT